MEMTYWDSVKYFWKIEVHWSNAKVARWPYAGKNTVLEQKRNLNALDSNLFHSKKLCCFFNPSSLHTATCVSAEILANVWKIYVGVVYKPAVCGGQAPFPLCLPPHTAGLDGWRRHSSTYALSLILCIYRYLPTDHSTCGKGCGWLTA